MRKEASQAAHGDDVMHAVSAMRGGTRYSLILFFYALADEVDSLEYQSVARSELYGAGSPAHAAAGAPSPDEAPSEAAAGGLLRRVGDRSPGGSRWTFVDGVAPPAGKIG